MKLSTQQEISPQGRRDTIVYPLVEKKIKNFALPAIASG